MRHSAIACEVYQTTDVANTTDWELQTMSVMTDLFNVRSPHLMTQAVPSMLTIPNTKAIIEKAIGMRLWMRLFVRPWILKVGNEYRVSVNKSSINQPIREKYVCK